MKRLSTNVTQKQLRALAVKHGMKEAANTTEKIESPLMKVDSKGQLICVICRTPLKSANIWKVHVNSKAHKNNVQAAKELKTTLLNAGTSTLKTNIPTKTDGNVKSAAVPKDTVHGKTTKTTPIESNSIRPQVASATVDTKSSELANKSLNDPLPAEFFDSSAAEAKAQIAENKDAEWELFQKEIKEVAEASYEIFVADQKELAVEKELVEIDEQIHHWSKVLELEEKRKKLNKFMEKNKSAHNSDESSDDVSETEDFDEYTDWRAKGFK
ncbi:zinc finger protein 830 [Musca vetustissima]|uniref:zinc finger protein 830 n=1 Tax=Musca vetustissima TaxID=27455 RepID=UPI002AB67322|nr:zinc finger protein 830 [Musca vetustissima]